MNEEKLYLYQILASCFNIGADHKFIYSLNIFVHLFFPIKEFSSVTWNI